MERIGDKIVVLAACAAVFASGGASALGVAALLLGIIETLVFELAGSCARCVPLALLLGACVALPAFAPLLPILLYDVATAVWKPEGRAPMWAAVCVGALAIIALAIALPRCVPVARSLVVLMSALGAMLSVRTTQTLALRKSQRAARDDLRGQSLALEQRNRDLQERQDLEVRLATMAERGRIARDIHDNVGHLLTRALLLIEAMRVRADAPHDVQAAQDAADGPAGQGGADGLAGQGGADEMAETGAPSAPSAPRGDSPACPDELDELQETLDEALESVRQSVRGLFDESVDCQQALYELAESFEHNNRLRVALAYHADDIPARTARCFIAVTREALSNVVRHSDANEVRVKVTEFPQLYALEIRDNGSGADVGCPASGKRGGASGATPGTAASRDCTGMGLAAMEERLLAMGGVFHAGYDVPGDAVGAYPNAPGAGRHAGFRVYATVPKPGSPASFPSGQPCDQR